MNRYLKGIKESRREIISEIYSNNYPPIRNFVVQNSGDEDSAQDVFQDVMLSLYKRLQKEDIEIKTSFNVYIFSMGKYIWFKRLRKMPTTMDINDLEMKSEIDASTAEEEKYRLFTEYVDKLGPDCRKVLNYFFEHKSFKEIATLMNYKSETFARRKKYLCKNSLFKIIKDDPEFIDLYNS